MFHIDLTELGFFVTPAILAIAYTLWEMSRTGEIVRLVAEATGGQRVGRLGVRGTSAGIAWEVQLCSGIDSSIRWELTIPDVGTPWVAIRQKDGADRKLINWGLLRNVDSGDVVFDTGHMASALEPARAQALLGDAALRDAISALRIGQHGKEGGVDRLSLGRELRAELDTSRLSLDTFAARHAELYPQLAEVARLVRLSPTRAQPSREGPRTTRSDRDMGRRKVIAAVVAAVLPLAFVTLAASELAIDVWAQGERWLALGAGLGLAMAAVLFAQRRGRESLLGLFNLTAMVVFVGATSLPLVALGVDRALGDGPRRVVVGEVRSVTDDAGTIATYRRIEVAGVGNMPIPRNAPNFAVGSKVRVVLERGGLGLERLVNIQSVTPASETP